MYTSDRNSSEIENGSITIYLCLVLCVLISLIFACMDSARVSAGRAALSCAVDEGLFSLFSNYDRELYERYGLLFMDGGYSSGQMRMGRLAEETREYTDRVLSPVSAMTGITPAKLYDISIDSADITGYTLATDSGFSPLIEQIGSVILLKLGADGIKAAGDSLDFYSEALEAYSLESEDEVDSLIEKYEAQKELAEELKAETEKEEGPEEAADTKTPGTDTEGVVVPEDFKNPIENIKSLKKLGLMIFALPEGEEVSAASIDLESTVSRRNLDKGMGLLPKEKDGITEKFAVSEFAAGFFSDFLTAGSEETLQYQTEYIIGGKADDASNLRSVMDKILLVRLGMNYIYLLSSADKAAEIYEVSSIIGAILLMPEGIEVIAQIVRMLWAYAESMMDVKSLLSGGNVPIFKDSATWQVSLSLFSWMDKDTKPQKKEKGLSYSEYLRLLMYIMPFDDLIGRTSDMIEYNRRKTDEKFRLDLCLDSFQIEFYGKAGGREISINRGYSYTF
jgi:hypothetical protein